MRQGYEYLRNWGIARVGLFGEMCAVSDMTYLAIKLSDYGVGDYWEDVDCYVRNILADRQITSADKLRKAVQTEPILARFLPRTAPTDPINNPNAQTVGLGQNLEKDSAKSARSIRLSKQRMMSSNAASEHFYRTPAIRARP